MHHDKEIDHHHKDIDHHHHKDIPKMVFHIEQCSVHPGWLCDIGDEMLPDYMGIIFKKNITIPYKPISIMERG